MTSYAAVISLDVTSQKNKMIITKISCTVTQTSVSTTASGKHDTKREASVWRLLRKRSVTFVSSLRRHELFWRSSFSRSSQSRRGFQKSHETGASEISYPGYQIKRAALGVDNLHITPVASRVKRRGEKWTGKYEKRDSGGNLPANIAYTS